ncbi:MAG: transcription antitermination protein NusB [Candidatus Phytoplasma stylosanthis]|uniref:transcription antitermination protein NusB n=1 Tax=Candidatus Phytoplasma stylosanthis TaxID=2798314 RepID=UPI002939B726|nr:transcription antitermination protein NusB [Candidatus Phytoplasma stylosanthis]MDV3167753.1 transcription antitermination protein NusB [Candidatus Phytoplasma stylosanthis]MDV3170970.1 transcription antitermination protein NusB [Candidatus Phytoplasma stylosanthis]MDV3174142.1 transcription antitermination protein NusB [Candidatus Phytoplasma stylosanthis]MDV3202339.1 transcription antitermination protein NusB [Candidatus Phytoplasma stylosanthis]
MLPKKIKKIRLLIIISLYQYDFYQEEFSNPNKDDIFDLNIFHYIIKNIQLIDFIIKKNLYNYKINRLNKVDKAIIRLATLELLEKQNSHKVIINEAIEITKEYSNLNDGKQHRFNNKLLQLIFEDIEKNKYKINEF